MLHQNIKKLVQYGIDHALLPECERIYATNLLLELFHETEYADTEINTEIILEQILKELLDEACARNIIEDSIAYRDLLDTKMMNCLMPRPAQVQDAFYQRYQQSPKDATQYYYRLSQDSDYIRTYRVKKDKKWTVDSDYGVIDITINLSKPEKDPKAIAAAGKQKSSSYPKCMLCMENEGYAGRLDFPARENHRIIPIEIDGATWGLQYSPYVYYNEHCIVFNGSHIPMKIDRNAFKKLFDFVKLFPHYFVGSNADLPIVGGSILSHEHFQGGNYEFAMAKAEVEETFSIKGYEHVLVGIVKWPLSVLRLRGTDADEIVSLAEQILDQWRGYTDEDAFIFAETDGEPHNTITPIARMKNGLFELDLVLRNNITTDEHPMGVFHPHAQYHHIKKENIGLIEVMGLAVLPARLQQEMAVLADAIVTGKDICADEQIEKHADWVKAFLPKYEHVNAETIMGILQQEIGITFVKILEDSGVYKRTEAGKEQFVRFVKTI